MEGWKRRVKEKRKNRSNENVSSRQVSGRVIKMKCQNNQTDTQVKGRKRRGERKTSTKREDWREEIYSTKDDVDDLNKVTGGM